MELTEKQKEAVMKACTVEYQNDIKKRKKMGQFFTPAPLVIKMIEKFEDLEGDFIDPCAGNGNLLVGLIAAGVSPNNIYYNELDVNEFAAGKERLMKLGVPESHFTNFDVLSDEFEQYYENAWMRVIMNPPYKGNLHLKILSKIIEIFQKKIL